MGYSDPNFTVRREAAVPPTTAGATTEGAKFRSFQAMRLKKAHFGVTIAGTATDHGYNIFHGTTSIGAVVVGTGAIGAAVHSAALDETVGSMEQVSVKSLADVVGAVQVVYEYEVTPDAVVS